MKTYLYARVSTDEQHDRGASIPAQIEAMRRTAAARGWDDAEVITEDGGASAKSLKGRPALAAALDDLDLNGGVLVALSVDRLTRSVVDLGTIINRASANRWSLVILDAAGIDTTTPHGEAFALMAGIVAQLERRLIAERTRRAMAERKRQGVHCGRQAELPKRVINRIVKAAAKGQSLRAIAHGLNEDGVPTAHGGARWHASTVRGVLRSSTAQALAA